MSRVTWTEADERIAWRRWAGYKHNLDDDEILPLYLRDSSRDPHWQPRTTGLPRRAKQAALEPSDEEPSSVTVLVVPVAYVLVGVGAVLVVAGVCAFRSLFG